MPGTPRDWQDDDPANAWSAANAIDLEERHFDNTDEMVALRIPNDIIEAKGDLILGDDAETPIRKPIGDDGTVLQADTNSAGGARWADAPLPVFPSVVAPIAGGIVPTVELSVFQGSLFLSHCLVPKSGTLRDFAYWLNGNTGGGDSQVTAAIYDTGQDDPDLLTKLWDSGPVLLPDTGVDGPRWEIAADPLLDVVRGQHLMLGISVSDPVVDPVAVIGAYDMIVAAVVPPTSYLIDEGAIINVLALELQSLDPLETPATIDVAAERVAEHLINQIPGSFACRIE